MQVRLSTFRSAQFRCPFNHDGAEDCLLKHGNYMRYVDAHSNSMVAIPRRLCKFTGKTLSILPDEMLPYWQLPVPQLEDHFQRQCSAAEEQSEQPPKPTNTELPQRAWKRFCSAARLQSLTEYFGQRFPFGECPKGLWQAMMRTGGTLSDILCELAQAGKSLLGDYRCLRPSGM